MKLLLVLLEIGIKIYICTSTDRLIVSILCFTDKFVVNIYRKHEVNDEAWDDNYDNPLRRDFLLPHPRVPAQFAHFAPWRLSPTTSLVSFLMSPWWRSELFRWMSNKIYINIVMKNIVNTSLRWFWILCTIVCPDIRREVRNTQLCYTYLVMILCVNGKFPLWHVLVKENGTKTSINPPPPQYHKSIIWWSSLLVYYSGIFWYQWYSIQIMNGLWVQ